MYATCIAGHSREYDNKISDANQILKNMQSDFYISTWEKTGSKKVFWSGDNDDETDNVDINSLINIYNPLNIDIENQNKYIKYNHFDLTLKTQHNVNVLNTILMFKKIKKSILYVIDSSKKYDVVFRSRFDLQDLVLPKIIEIQDNIIYSKQSPTNGFISDCFFYGTPDTMLKAIPDETFYTEDIIETALNAEEIFSRYLTKENIEVKFVDELSFKIKDIVFS
jgi:hypothetical protein